MYKIYNKNDNKLIISEEKIDGDLKHFKVEPDSPLDEMVDLFKQNNDVNIISYLPQITWNRFKSLFSNVETSGGLVKNQRGDFLFIFKNNRWDLPKGHIETGENLEECAIREVKEESGLKDLKIIKKLPNTYHIFTEEDKYILKTCNWFEMIHQGNKYRLIPQVTERIIDAAWVKEKNIKIILKQSYKSIHSFFNYNL